MFALLLFYYCFTTHKNVAKSLIVSKMPGENKKSKAHIRARQLACWRGLHVSWLGHLVLLRQFQILLLELLRSR